MSDIENPRDPADADVVDPLVDPVADDETADDDTVTGIDAERAVPTGVDDFDIDITESDGPDLEAGDDLDTGAATS